MWLCFVCVPNEGLLHPIQAHSIIFTPEKADNIALPAQPKTSERMNVNQTTPTCTSTTPRRTKSEFPIKVYAMLELAGNIFEFAQAVT